MLMKQKIESGAVNKIFSAGKYIKIIDCVGELNISVFSKGEKVLDTAAYKSFEFMGLVFDEINITATTEQQYKVWVSDYRMGYSPIESTQVGSAGLVSESKNISFGQPQMLVSENAGRKSVTMSAKKPIKIGGLGVDQSTAILVPENTPFKLDTQAAVYAFSEDKDDAVRVLTDLSGQISETHTIETGGNKYGIFYNQVKKYTYLLNHTGLKLGMHVLNEQTLTMSSKLTEVSGESVSLIESGDYLAISAANPKSVVSINGDTFAQTVLATVEYNIVHLGVSSSGKWVAISSGAAAATSYDGNAVGSVAPPSIVSPKIIVSIGERIILFGENNVCITDDYGVTWDYNILPESLKGGVVNFNVVVDELTGDLIYTGISGNIWISKNKGISFEPLFLVSDANILGCTALGGSYAAMTMTKIYYNTPKGSGVVDNGENWFSTGTLKSIGFANTGHLVVGELSRWRFWSTDKYLEVGGVAVSLLSEVN